MYLTATLSLTLLSYFYSFDKLPSTCFFVTFEDLGNHNFRVSIICWMQNKGSSNAKNFKTSPPFRTDMLYVLSSTLLFTLPTTVDSTSSRFKNLLLIGVEASGDSFCICLTFSSNRFFLSKIWRIPFNL